MFSSKVKAVLILIIAAVIAGDPAGLVHADKPSNNTVDEKQESLKVRYARAHLELARIDLLRALAFDKKHPRVMPTTAIENLQRHVVVDKEQLKQALKGGDANLHEVYVRSAEFAVVDARTDLKRKQKSFDAMPTEEGELDIQRAKALVKVAELQLESTHAQEVSLSSLQYLQWQIGVLRNELLELRVRVETKRR